MENTFICGVKFALPLLIVKATEPQFAGVSKLPVFDSFLCGMTRIPLGLCDD